MITLLILGFILVISGVISLFVLAYDMRKNMEDITPYIALSIIIITEILIGVILVGVSCKDLIAC